MAIKAKDATIIAERDVKTCLHKKDGKYIQCAAIIEDDLYKEFFCKEDEFHNHPDKFGDMEWFRDHFNV